MAFIVVVLISIVLLISTDTLGLNNYFIRFPKIDTIGHLTSFFVLTWVTHTLIKLPLFTTVITLSFYGALSELGQFYLGFRNGELTDFFADVTGIFCFVLLRCFYHYFYSSDKNKRSMTEKHNE